MQWKTYGSVIKKTMIYDSIVIGGGPAGMMAAYAAAEDGAKVLLLEKNEKLGKKLYITGKGRCNLTNNAEIKDFFLDITRNPKFLMSAFNKFSNKSLVELFENNGLKTKIERGGRVFPQSGKSSDVISVLSKILNRTGVKIRLNQTVVEIKKLQKIFIIKTQDNEYKSKTVVVATGGLSYPATGSTGDGYLFAKKFGHLIAPPSPALAPLAENGDICAKLQGLSLKNVNLKLLADNDVIYTENGELLFTHFGLSGPLALTASCYLCDVNNISEKKLTAVIDLKPALSFETLNNRILRDIEKNHNKHIKTYLKELLPSKMIEPFLEKSGLDGETPLNSLIKKDRKRLINELKDFEVNIKGVGSFKEAIITAGGINVNEINPSTMESKITEGLYFAGEVIDVSAKTGGYNLQIAFSTGYAAGKSLLSKIDIN